jgi:hypothetical protein
MGQRRNALESFQMYPRSSSEKADLYGRGGNGDAIIIACSVVSLLLPDIAEQSE